MADKISISNVDEVYVKIDCEAGIGEELRSFFTFMVPGYQFTPQYRARLWDGKIRLFDLRTKRIYRGLVPYIVKFCEERKYDLEYDNEIYDEEFSLSEAKQFIKTLNLPDKLVPRDYQIEAFTHAVRSRRALLLSPTASGKSLIIYLIMRYLYANCNVKRTLIIVPTISLVSQLSSDFRDYGYDSDNLVHPIFAGKDKQSDKKVYISTWQSLFKLPKEYFEQFDFVVGDEAHLFKAMSLQEIMTKLTRAKYRIGTTGTLDGTKCFDGNTLVSTSEGEKKIKNILRGDTVYSYNEETKLIEYKKVLDVFNNGKRKRMVRISIDEKVIVATPEHLFFTMNRGWIQAQHLSIDDEMLDISINRYHNEKCKHRL